MRFTLVTNPPYDCNPDWNRVDYNFFFLTLVNRPLPLFGSQISDISSIIISNAYEYINEKVWQILYQSCQDIDFYSMRISRVIHRIECTIDVFKELPIDCGIVNLII
jgi:hypothetical protein